MNNIISKLFNVLLLIVIIALIFKTCEFRSEHDRLLAQMSSYQQGEKQFKVKLQKDSSTIASQSQTILTQKEAIRLGQLKLEGEIKKAQSQVAQTQVVKIKNIEVPYIPDGFVDTTAWRHLAESGIKNDSICDSVIANAVILPKSFHMENKWYSINGEVKKYGVLFDSIRIINESTVTVGWKKGGFLNLKKIPIVEIKNTNPYLSVTKMNNVNIKPNKGLFQKKGFWLILGGSIIYLLK